MKTKNLISLILMLTCLLLLSSCADKQNVDVCVVGDSVGFWYGLWHGMITPISFLCSLFSDKYSVYAVNNTGGWYDFGFLLGVGGLGWGSSRRRKD